MIKSYTDSPDSWVVIKITTDGKVNYKVFATWTGGYTSGDAWRMNSGVDRVEEDENYYYFYGFSGSCYRCHKKTYNRLSSYGSGVLNNLLEYNRNHQSHWDTEMEVMDENTDFINLRK